MLGKAQLAVTGTVDAHIVDGQAEWVDLGVDATGEVRFGDRAEVRITSFTLTGRLEGLTASLTMGADLNVLGRDVSVSGAVAATFGVSAGLVLLAGCAAGVPVLVAIDGPRRSALR